MTSLSLSALPRSALFEAGPWRAWPLSVDDAPWLQDFFNANPLYFVTVNGRPAGPGDALAELTERPPAEMPFRDLHWLAFVDEDQLILQRVPVTLAIIGASQLVALAIALPVGIYSATRPYSVFDQIANTLAFIGMIDCLRCSHHHCQPVAWMSAR